MISLIVYGRNDSHGYNLHKRAAISLNCLAEILDSNSDDEIIFVDWNTPLGFPTFPEAIQDTLTEKCISVLKTIRVAPKYHKVSAAKSNSKSTIEPIARNVGIRRSNPNNKWILSTNTDMIFLNMDDSSFREKLINTQEGYYATNRHSIPDGIWETFDRNLPLQILNSLKQSINEVDILEVISAGKIQKFDAPGDFQLVPRKTLFELRGFDEEMQLGWHVDSNLAKRLYLFYGETKEFDSNLIGFHCEHTRSLTHFHNSKASNDLYKFYESVENPKTNLDYENWGLGGINLPEINLNLSLNSKKFQALKKVSKFNKTLRSPVRTTRMSNLVTYPFYHALPYILDNLDGYQKEDLVIYIGNQKNTAQELGEIIFSLFEVRLNIFDLNNFELIKQLLIKRDGSEKVFIVDFGHELASTFDISKVYHSQFNYKYQEINVAFLQKLMNLIVENIVSSNTKFVFLNTETYGYGIGNFVKKFFEIPSVAANSRVRAGYLRSSFATRGSDVKNRLVERALNEFDFLKQSELSIEYPLKQITSHKMWGYFQNTKILEWGSPGLMFSKIKGQLEFKNASNLQFAHLEIDVPFSSENISKTYKIYFEQTNMFSPVEISHRGGTELITFDLHSSKKFNYTISGVDADKDNNIEELLPIRLTNLYFSENLIKTSNFNSSSKNSVFKKFILNSGWSYSQERDYIWAASKKLVVNLEFARDISTCSKFLYILMSNFAKSEDVTSENFKIYLDESISSNLLDSKMFNVKKLLPHFIRKESKYAILKVSLMNLPEGTKKLVIKTNFDSFAPFSISPRDGRKLFFKALKIHLQNDGLFGYLSVVLFYINSYFKIFKTFLIGSVGDRYGKVL